VRGLVFSLQSRRSMQEAWLQHPQHPHCPASIPIAGSNPSPEAAVVRSQSPAPQVTKSALTAT